MIMFNFNLTSLLLQDKVKNLSHDLSDLEKELDTMKPPGRDIKTVKQQLDDIGRYYKRLEKADDLVADAERAVETLVDSGYSDTANTRNQVGSHTLKFKAILLDVEFIDVNL